MFAVDCESYNGDNAMANQQGDLEKTVYHIRVKGHLDNKWADWFEGFVMASRGDGETLLSGSVMDQAALHGVLDKLHSLGLPLLLVVKHECPCTNSNCSKRGLYQECAAYHAYKGGTPYCFKARSRWDNQCAKMMR